MKLTLFSSDNFQIEFLISSLNHYGKQFFCFDAIMNDELVEFLVNRGLIYKQHTNRFTICREVKFKIS